MSELGIDQKDLKEHSISYAFFEVVGVIIKVAWFVIGIIIEIQLVKFVLRWAESTGDYPHWINAGSFWGWVVGFVASFIAGRIIEIISQTIMATLGGIVQAITEQASHFATVVVRSVYVIMVYGGVLWLSIFIANKWFDFASSHYEFNDFYVYAGEFMFLMHILAIMGIILAEPKNDSE